MSKAWGPKEYWGCGSDYDPDWVLSPEQRELRDKLVELCRTHIRPKAASNDENYVYPRESLDSLASLGLLGLFVPKELGGLGESHVCAAMVVETIARYGCPSTALTYCMHLVSTSMLIYRYTTNPTVISLLKDMNKKKLIGTSVHSDPATGGHFWFPLSSKVKTLPNDMLRVLKYGSWATSAGHADWYAVNTLSPDNEDQHGNLATFLCFRDEVRAYSGDWRAMGMHGNMSGALVVDCVVSKDRMICAAGEGAQSNDEAAAPMFLLSSSACWNGIAMACMDVAKKHVTRKALGDVGMRICDYASVQDHVGSCLCSTNSCRLALFSVAQQMDKATDQNNWRKTCETKTMPRSTYNFWLWQSKHNSAKNVSEVADKMLMATGGTGYKSELGLERLVRDAKAGSVMAPNNEVVRSLLGQAVLIGPETLDLWCQNPNTRVLQQEVSKMSAEEKQKLAITLLEEVENETKTEENIYEDFDNPFSTEKSKYLGLNFSVNGTSCVSALQPDIYTGLELQTTFDHSNKMSSFVFALPPGTNHSGLLAGQYVKVLVETADHGNHERYFSPVSRPSNDKNMELVMRYESHGIVSEHFQAMKNGDIIKFLGPCGGFEYTANQLNEITLLASGGGVTPCLQLIRSAAADKKDTTKMSLLYYADTQTDLLYKEELDSYVAKSGGRLRVGYSVGEVGEGEWLGEEGFIDSPMIEKHINLNTSPKHKIVICGGPNMSLSCCYALRSLGFESSQIFIYGQFGAAQIKRVYGRNATLANHTCR